MYYQNIWFLKITIFMVEIFLINLINRRFEERIQFIRIWLKLCLKKPLTILFSMEDSMLACYPLRFAMYWTHWLVVVTKNSFKKNNTQFKNKFFSLFTGAIKFGDVLSLKQCIQLIKGLSQCDVPFQCAHGRPLVAPLMELNDVLPLTTTPVFRPKYHRLHDWGYLKSWNSKYPPQYCLPNVTFV